MSENFFLSHGSLNFPPEDEAHLYNLVVNPDLTVDPYPNADSYIDKSGSRDTEPTESLKRALAKMSNL